MKKLSIALLLSTSMLITSCGLNMKPEHQQAYDSFDKRRSPRDNQIASTGGLSDRPSGVSNFSEFSGSVVGKSSETGRTVTDSKTTSGYSAQSVTDSVKATINSTTTQDNVPTAPNTSVIDRLKEKFSFNSSNESKFASARMRPIENNPHIQVASVAATTYTQTGQGSDVASYDYYDLADEIDMHSDSYKIEDNKLIQLAKNDSRVSASAPLVDVEDAPSYEEIKSQANLDARPEIKDIPNAPQRVREHQLKNQIPSQQAAQPKNQEKIEVRTIKEESHSRQPAQQNLMQAQDKTQNMESGYTLEDRSARVVYMEGKPVVTGTLGSLRK